MSGRDAMVCLRPVYMVRMSALGEHTQKTRAVERQRVRMTCVLSSVEGKY